MKMSRIRTWAVYYLTQRGGGRQTEPKATGIWESAFDDPLETPNFRGERDRLFDVWVTKQRRKKRIRKDPET
jgi:hypothetical protein